MASFGFTFDASTVEPARASYPVAPAGDYLMQIVASEMKATSSGNGQMLALTVEIIEGEFQGVRVYDNLNIINQNQTTVDIALKTLSAICHATGQVNIEDSEQLHFIPFTGKVKMIPEGHVTPAKNGRPAYTQQKAKNEMGGYSLASGSAIAGKPASTPAPQQAVRPVAPVQNAQPATRTPAPWGAKKVA